MVEQRVITAQGIIEASAEEIFELIADPARQPKWDGNDNLSAAEPGPRIRAVGEVFTMILTNDQVRQNHVVEFVENRLIAWKPAERAKPQPGHLWRWELEQLEEGSTRVTHTYDWTELNEPRRIVRAQSTTSEMLTASIDRLRVLAEAA